MEALLGVVVLVLIAITMFAVVGMHLVGGSLPIVDCEGIAGCDHLAECPRFHFETVPNGMLTSLHFMISENWVEVMGWYMHHSGPKAGPNSEGNNIGQILTASYFRTLFFICNGLLLNLFVAVLLLNFGSSDDDKMPLQKAVYWANHRYDNSSTLIDLNLAVREQEGTLISPTASAASDDDDLVTRLAADATASISHRSFFVFRPVNGLRIFCAKVVTSRVYENVFTVFILVACFSIATRSEETADRIAACDGSESWPTAAIPMNKPLLQL